MATPSVFITTVNGKRCTRIRRSTQATALFTSSIQQTSTTSTASNISSTQISFSQSTNASIPPAVSSAAPIASSNAASPGTGSTSSLVNFSSALASSAAQSSPAASSASFVPFFSQDISSSQAPSRTKTGSPSSLSLELGSSTSIFSLQFPSTQSNRPSTTAIPVSLTTGPAVSQTVAVIPGASTGGVSVKQSNNLSPVSIAAIAGGVTAGLVALALIGVLIFFYRKRRRRRDSLRTWKRGMDEKRRADEGQGPASGRQSSAESMRDIANQIGDAIGVFFARFKRSRDSMGSDPQRQNTRYTTSSVYSSRPPTSRARSSSAPANGFRKRLEAFADRLPAVKDWRARFQRSRTASIGSVPPSPTAEIARGSIDDERGDPFRDPAPKRLTITNPDHSRSALGTPRSTIADGLQDQQRGPITPRTPKLGDSIFPSTQISLSPTIKEANENPFADPIPKASAPDNPFLDPPGIISARGNATLEFLREAASKHKRTQSTGDALTSNPPSSSYPSSYYQPTTPPPPSSPPPAPINPSFDASDYAHQTSGPIVARNPAPGVSAPPIPRRSEDRPSPPQDLSSTIRKVEPTPEPENMPQKPASIYLLPTPSPGSSVSRNPSNFPFNTNSFAESIPPSRSSSARNSRPPTAYTVASRAARGKSDPFDLDRPEVLGYGPVGSRRDASITRSSSIASNSARGPWNEDCRADPRANYLARSASKGRGGIGAAMNSGTGNLGPRQSYRKSYASSHGRRSSVPG